MYPVSNSNSLLQYRRRKNGKYRFTLQFPADTEEQIQAGELLERLGNKKSAVLVAALCEYLQAHPALQNPACKIELKATHSYLSEALAELVREMVGEQLAQASGTGAQESPNVPQTGSDVAEMLENLEMFL